VLPELADMQCRQDDQSGAIYKSLNREIADLFERIHAIVGSVTICIYWHNKEHVQGEFFCDSDSICKNVSYRLHKTLDNTILDPVEAVEQLLFAKHRLDVLCCKLNGPTGARSSKKRIVSNTYMGPCIVDIVGRLTHVLCCYMHKVVASEQQQLKQVQPHKSVLILV
jgi:hypothetical protein